MMLIGALGMKIVPADYFGVIERFSVFAVTGFNCALGLHLFFSKDVIEIKGKEENGLIEKLDKEKCQK